MALPDSLAGYLKKSNFFGTYGKKYFKIEGDILSYGKDKNHLKKKIPLKEVYLDKDLKRSNKFSLYTNKRKISIKAENSNEREKWVNAISKFA